MQITSGKVVHVRIELDAELPEGASVTVIAADDDTFEASAATGKMSPRRHRRVRARADDSAEAGTHRSPPERVSDRLDVVVSALARGADSHSG